MFLLSGGVAFSEWGKQHRSLMIVASIFGLIGSYYLSVSAYNDVKSMFFGNSSSEEPIASPAANGARPSKVKPNPPVERVAKTDIGPTASANLPSDRAAAQINTILVDKFGPDELVFALAVSPIEPHVAIVTSPSSPKDKLSIWDYRTGTLIAMLAENLRHVSTTKWSADGRSIFVREQTRVLEFHVASGRRRIHIENAPDTTFMHINENTLTWVGLPYPRKTPISDIPSQFAMLRKNYQLDSFGYFKLKPPKSKKKGGYSLSVTPEEVRANHEARAREQRFRKYGSETSVCERPRGNLKLGLNGETAVLYDFHSFCVWNTVKGEPLQVIRRIRREQINAAAVSRDGATLALGAESGDIEIWDSNKWTLLRILSGHNAGVASVAFSPDGSMLVSGGASGDGRVIIWDILRGSVLEKHVSQVDGGAGKVAFTQDGKAVLSGRYGVRVWERK